MAISSYFSRHQNAFMNFHKLLVQSLLWRGIYFITILLLNVFLARYLKAEGAGWVYYLTNWFSFLLIIASLSMESAVTYYASSNTINKHKLVWLSVVWTVFVAAIIYAGYSFYVNELKNGEIPKENVYYALYYICGILLTNFFTVLFYAQRNFLLPNLIMSLLNIIIIIVIPKGNHTGYTVTEVLNIYFFFFLLQGVILAIAYSLKNKSFHQFALPTTEENRLLLKYAFVSLAANVVFFLVYRIDYWFVRHSPVCTKEDLGNYIQVSKIGQMLLIIPQIMASAVFPHTASGSDRKDVNRSIMIVSRLLTQLYLLGIVIVLLFGRKLFPFVFGPTFDKMYVPMLLLIPGILSLSILALLSAYFSGKGNVAVNFKGAVVALIFVAIGNAVFVRQYGIHAAAIVSSVGYTINLLYALRQFYKDYDIGLIEFFAWNKDDYRWFIRSFLKS